MKFTQHAVACVVALAALTDARPSPSTHAVHEKRDGALRTWIKRDRVASDAILPIKIGLKQENLHRGYDHLMDV
jgi:tripeptidyl-peptidase-1